MRFNLNIVYYFLENRDIMEEKRKIKIKVEDLIFGKRKQEALALLKKGVSKRRNLKMYRWGQ
jgi:hypothetical protein